MSPRLERTGSESPKIAFEATPDAAPSRVPHSAQMCAYIFTLLFEGRLDSGLEGNVTSMSLPCSICVGIDNCFNFRKLPPIGKIPISWFTFAKPWVY